MASEIEKASKSGDPVKALTALRDRLAKEIDRLGSDEKWLLPQLSSQLMAVIGKLTDLTKPIPQVRLEPGYLETGDHGNVVSAQERFARAAGTHDSRSPS